MKSRAPNVNLRTYRPPHEATKFLSRRFCEDHAVIPVNAIGPSLIIAMVNPDDQATIDAVAAQTGLKVEVVRASADEITDSITACYGKAS